jgi:CubicO group peptidase (beta-lactamase class C family)
MKSKITKKISSLLIVFLLIGIGFVSTSVYANNIKKDVSIDIDIELNTIIKQAKIPSISTCIIKNDKMVWYGGYGEYNRLLNLVPTKDTVYMAASVSKSFAATALLQLYEDSLFELDEDVSNYLPFVLRNPKYPDVPITFEMLLSHRSSLSMTPLSDLISFGIIYLFFSKNYPYPALEWHLVPGGILYRKDIWTDNIPGEAFNYSNTGYLLLEYLIEQISGISYSKYCYDNILKPLEMDNSSFNIRSIKRSQRAVPYLLRNKILNNRLVRLPFYVVPDYAAGGLVTSIEDLSHFLIAQMNNGTYKDYKLLENSSVEIMHTIYSENTTSSGFRFSYGLGWMFYDINGTYFQGHDGDTFGFTARMVFNEENKTGIIFFFNRTRKGEEDLELSNELIEILFKKSQEFL